MAIEDLARNIRYGHEWALRARCVYQRNDVGPYLAFGRLTWHAWFTASTQNCANRCRDWRLIFRDQNDSRSTVSGNIGSRRIDNMSQIPLRQKLFDQHFAEF